MQMLWDSIITGNLQNRRGARFIPGGVKPLDTKEKALMDAQVQEWLVRVMCFCLGLNPMPFIKQMNRGQEATHHTESKEEGLGPWLEWVANFMNTLIALKWARRDIVFRWAEADETDPKTQAEIDGILVDKKIFHPDEIRVKRGDVPMPPEMRAQMDVATFAATPNATQLPPEQQAAADERAAQVADAEAKRLAAVKPTAKESSAEKMVTVNLPEIKLGDTFIDVGRGA